MDRKEIVQALGEHFGVKPKYMGVPSFAYQIETATETYIIDRAGKITTVEGKEVEFETLVNGTREEGIVKPEAEMATDEPTGLSISIPLDAHTGSSLRNLVNIIYSKQDLIKKAVGMDEDIVSEELMTAVNEAKALTLEEFQTAIQNIEGKGIGFNFERNIITLKLGRIEDAPEKITAYTQLVELISEQAKTLKYASTKAKDTNNEKFTFRVWLNRLGMIGDEYKQTRKLLLQNLTGNSAFRYGKPKKETATGE